MLLPLCPIFFSSVATPILSLSSSRLISPSENPSSVCPTIVSKTGLSGAIARAIRARMSKAFSSHGAKSVESFFAFADRQAAGERGCIHAYLSSLEQLIVCSGS